LQQDLSFPNSAHPFLRRRKSRGSLDPPLFSGESTHFHNPLYFTNPPREGLSCSAFFLFPPFDRLFFLPATSASFSAGGKRYSSFFNSPFFSTNGHASLLTTPFSSFSYEKNYSTCRCSFFRPRPSSFFFRRDRPETIFFPSLRTLFPFLLLVFSLALFSQSPEGRMASPPSFLSSFPLSMQVARSFPPPPSLLFLFNAL